MRGGVFKPGFPISISDLKEVVTNANMGQPRTLGGSVDTSAGESGAAYQPTGTQVTNLRIVKVTGTVTGGYSFTEVYDPDGDGTYTTSPYGINSVSTSVYLVAKSGVTFATNDLVVARLNPYHPYRWEGLCVLSGGSATTNTLNFNTGTRDLTSTVNGVAAVANIPATATLSTASAVISATENILAAASGTWTDIANMTLTLSTGTWLVLVKLTYAIIATTNDAGIYSRLTIGGTAINDSEALCVRTDSPTLTGYQSITISAFVVATGNTLKVQFYKQPGSGTFTLAQLEKSAGLTSSTIQAIKVA